MNTKILLLFTLSMLLSCRAVQAYTEKEIMTDADTRIEKIRKGDFIVRVKDKNGKLIKDVDIDAGQTNHEFLFGCNFFLLNPDDTSTLQTEYRQEFKELLNYATLPFYQLIFKKDELRYEKLESMAKWCRQNNIIPKGHPLVWHQGAPISLGKNKNVGATITKGVEGIVSRYKGIIDYWDVINESTLSATQQNVIGAWVRSLDYKKAPGLLFQKVKKANPKGFFLINDFNINGEDYRSQIKYLLDNKYQVNAIGIQSHMHSGEWYITDVWGACEKYGNFGIPIHFTELTVLSGSYKRDNDWNTRRPNWKTTEKGEKKQAEYVEKVYTVLFSHPMVAGITWWDFSDLGSWMGAPAGLVREDMSPKPAYNKLYHLIKEKWWTKTQGMTDPKGEFRFRGFYGTYNITVTGPDGKKITKEYNFRKGEKNILEINM